MFWYIQVWQLSNLSLKGFFPDSMKMVKYEDGMLILGQNYIFCGKSKSKSKKILFIVGTL